MIHKNRESPQNMRLSRFCVLVKKDKKKDRQGSYRSFKGSINN